MKKHLFKSAMLGCACVMIAATSLPAKAEIETPSVEYYGGKKTYDRNIEKAAIKRAAEKVGKLRGSLEGVQDDYIVLERELKKDQSSHLGFPIIREDQPDRDAITGSTPLI